MFKKDMTGHRFGRLVVTSFSHQDNRRKSYWNTVCDCGNTKAVSGYNLGRTVNSCGCLQSESRATHSTTHGLRKTRTYAIWNSMKQRCNNQNSMFFPDYGARGISVCRRWENSFQNFIDDMGECPEGMSLERVNNNGDYSPENCKWATKTEQARNRRSNRIITFNGESLTLAEWAERTGVCVGTLHSRLNRDGLSIEDALTKPINGRQ